MSNDTLNILAISGSLRQKSFNSGALQAAKEIAPNGVNISICDISQIPLYNDDVYAKGFPAAVEDFRKQIKNADAILIATPEYNYSVPGVLKNAIDWASRPPEQPFSGKPMAILSASPGIFGGARAQYHLRQCFIYMNPHILNQPEVMIGGASTKFDESGKLTDQKSIEQIKKLLDELVALTKKLRK